MKPLVTKCAPLLLLGTVVAASTATSGGKANGDVASLAADNKNPQKGEETVSSTLPEDPFQIRCRVVLSLTEKPEAL